MSRRQTRDSDGVALYRHEAIAAVLQVRHCDAGARLSVLLSRRRHEPFTGLYALPSGAVEASETLDQAVLRHLCEKVDVAGLTHLEQLGTQSDPARDPAQRTIGTSYLGLVPSSAAATLPEFATWAPVDDLPPMAFDHTRVVRTAAERLRAKLSYTNLGFALMDEAFTIAELREAYSAALGYDIAATNLERVLTRRGQLEATGEVVPASSRGGRPARRFRFVERRLVVTDPFAVLRPE